MNRVSKTQIMGLLDGQSKQISQLVLIWTSKKSAELAEREGRWKFVNIITYDFRFLAIISNQ